MKNSNVVWALVAGLAVGYIFGNKFPMSGGGGGGGASSSSSEHSTGGAVAGPIPGDWITEKDIGATELFNGLTSAQRYLALKVLNTKPCDCGCPHGSIAKCKKEDPGCPVAPKEIEIAAREAKAGKSYEAIYAAVKKPDQPAAAAAEPSAYKMPIANWTPVRGPKAAKVTIVMFSDFQCPFCGRVEPTLKQIVDTYGKDVRIAWRNQPLSFHSHAMEAAEAAMAANAQGKFWPMHDKLFSNQQALERPNLDKYAEEIGLNMAKYKAAMEGHLYKEQIDSDSKVGTAAGASGTPAFFINGQFLSGAQPFDSFKKVIDGELTKADALLKKGTSLDKLYQAELDALPAK
jgi:protein-disulfide isomerase